MAYTFIITSDGKLPIGMRQTVTDKLKEFAGKKVTLSIALAKEKRNLDQNALYWGTIIPHVRSYRAEMGDPVSEDEVHEGLLIEFAPRVPRKYLSEFYDTSPMRSKHMSVKEMADYITAITARMAMLDAPIPMQGEYN